MIREVRAREVKVSERARVRACVRACVSARVYVWWWGWGWVGGGEGCIHTPGFFSPPPPHPSTLTPPFCASNYCFVFALPKLDYLLYPCLLSFARYRHI